MADQLETIPASALTPAALGGDTRVTPTIPGGEAAAPATPTSSAPATPPEDLERDSAGVAFDAAKHEHRRKADGTWKLRRGNGARQAKGAPLVMPDGKGKSRVVLPPPAPPSESRALIVSSPASTPGASGVVVDAELAPETVLTEADYAASAASIVAALFGGLALLLGAAWRLADDERAAWREAIARLWTHYQWPKVGPWLELLSLGAITTEKRAGDPETRRRVGRVLDWLIPARKAKRPAKIDDQVDDAKAAA